MSLFCLHEYRPKKVLRGENLLGSVTYAVASYCIKCGKRKMGRHFSSRDAAEEWLNWSQPTIPTTKGGK